ncbi:hypothetical protein C8R45DRAFT_1210320 [Mycena sanguinolenta]|nr:hypothetical protein C8R45DRAFT_1210320 [Mycena sanguinolenta]
MSEIVQVHSTVGAALAGCLVAVACVGWIWILDAVHTIAVCASVWSYAIAHFGNPEFTTQIVPTLAVTVATTAITTFSVNIFYAWRIHKMSRANWWLTAPIVLLAISRIGLAFVTTTEMILTKNFPAFAAGFNIVLTSGMSVSAATDIIVSAARYYYLRNLKQGYSGTQEVVDAVVVFTINDGALTCAIAIAAIIFLLRMPNNFIWLGIYFNISKLFSNSVLATLNLRNWYRHRQRPMGIAMMRPQVLTAHTISSRPPTMHSSSKRTAQERVQVFVDQEVEYNVSDRGFGAEDSRSTKSAVDTI